MRRFRALTVLVGTALVWTAVGTVPSADASVVTTVYTTDGGRAGGKATWTAYGDKLTVCDRDADGYSAVGVLQWIGDDHYTHRFQVIATGSGNCKTVDKNIEDHRTGWVSVYLTHAGTNSPWVGYHNVDTTT